MQRQGEGGVVAGPLVRDPDLRTGQGYTAKEIVEGFVVRLAPRGTRTTRLGLAIKAIPVLASIAASKATGILVGSLIVYSSPS